MPNCECCGKEISEEEYDKYGRYCKNCDDDYFDDLEEEEKRRGRKK